MYLSMQITIYILILTILDYMSYPISMDITASDQESAELPTIRICPQGRLSCSDLMKAESKYPGIFRKALGLSGCKQRYQDFKKDYDDFATFNEIVFGKSMFKHLLEDEEWNNVTGVHGDAEVEFWEELYLIYNNPEKRPALNGFAYDLTLNPDIFCILFGVGSFCNYKR